MHSTVLPADVLYFHCENCGAELSVPISLHGVEGPCPTCGDTIKAPELYIPSSSSPESEGLLNLPPLDGRHEPPAPVTKTIPVPDWMNRQIAPPADPLSDPGQKAPLPVAVMRPMPTAAGLLPKQISSVELREFKARHTIPEFDSEPDDSWVDRHRSQQQRQMVRKKLDRAAHHFLDSAFFRAARVALLVITGGLCAGLTLYLKDRKWMLDLPWSQNAVEDVADTPLTPPAANPGPAPSSSTQAATSENPFLVEDASELEKNAGLPAMTPVPDPVSVPVGASPIVSGKN